MEERTMKVDWELNKSRFHESWHTGMKDIIEGREVYDLFSFFKSQTAKGVKLVPESKNLFKSFEVNLEEMPLFIMGQD